MKKRNHGEEVVLRIKQSDEYRKLANEVYILSHHDISQVEEFLEMCLENMLSPESPIYQRISNEIDQRAIINRG